MSLASCVKTQNGSALASNTSAADQQEFEALRRAVQDIMPSATIARIMQDSPQRAESEIRSVCRRAFSQGLVACEEENREVLVERLIDLIFGLGPLQGLLDDDSVTEIMVNGCTSLFFERDGVIQKSESGFADNSQVRAIIDRIIGPLGRRIDEASPMVNARLPQGYRVHAIIPPLALDGPILTIRKFSTDVMQLDQMIACQTMTEDVALFLSWVVAARKNVAVSGGTGSGKTTLLNALSCKISHNERIITIEDSAELRFLDHPHVIRLEARPENAEGKGRITIRTLVVNALRMRPDRIIVGECREAEALDMLQAMNTGHDGSLTTLHANSPYDAVLRLATMVRYAADLPLDAIDAQIGSALDLIVQVARDVSGTRFIQAIAELAFDGSSRSLSVHTLYERKHALDKGRWFSAPSWIDDLCGCSADEREVQRWMESVLPAA